MKSFIGYAIGAVIASASGFAVANSTTITFENPITEEFRMDGTIQFNTQGYSFYSKDGVGEWDVMTSEAPYLTGVPGGKNITGFGPGPSDELHSWAFSSTSGNPFTLQGFEGCCAPIFLQLSKASGGAIFLGWDGTTVLPSQANGLLGPTQKGFYTVDSWVSNIPLLEVAVWSVDNNFAIDTIKVTMVPEPASVAMMLAGLAAIGAVVRRRKEALRN